MSRSTVQNTASDLRALVVEDDEWMKPIIVSSLWEAAPGIQVDWVDTAEEASIYIRRNAYAVIIADIFLSGEESGIEFWNHCQGVCPQTPVLLTSSMPVDKFLKNVSRETVCPPFLPKPFKVGECKQMIEGLLSYLKLSSERLSGLKTDKKRDDSTTLPLIAVERPLC